MRAHAELPPVSGSYPPPDGRLPTWSSPVRHVSGPKATPFDLHALGTPPALILSQDQTLHHCGRSRSGPGCVRSPDSLRSPQRTPRCPGTSPRDRAHVLALCLSVHGPRVRVPPPPRSMALLRLPHPVALPAPQVPPSSRSSCPPLRAWECPTSPWGESSQFLTGRMTSLPDSGRRVKPVARGSSLIPAPVPPGPPRPPRSRRYVRLRPSPPRAARPARSPASVRASLPRSREGSRSVLGPSPFFQGGNGPNSNISFARCTIASCRSPEIGVRRPG
jgi:hypothetical protein